MICHICSLPECFSKPTIEMLLGALYHKSKLSPTSQKSGWIKTTEKKILLCHLISVRPSLACWPFLWRKLHFNALLGKASLHRGTIISTKHYFYTGFSECFTLTVGCIDWVCRDWTDLHRNRSTTIGWIKPKKITKPAWLDVFTPWRFVSQHLSLAWRSQLLL